MDNLLHAHRKSSKSDAIIVEDKLSTDKSKIADAFNTHFATVCMTDENANQNLSQYDKYLKNPKLMHLSTLNKLKIPQCFTL